ncbi:MAG: histidine phosphatase family protein [Crocinitomicaceae bacterium]|nr:histidine phosphatase family protein [Crocinitomicaceae bacterium]MDG2505579.1 histidine phosphatase family protein [Crocinitomicaceae bacterium]
MRLYLLRHADASSSSKGDFQRELSKKGIAQCKALSGFLSPKIKEDAVTIHSSASQRTRQTHSYVFDTLNTTFHQTLYLATAQDLLQFICGLNTTRNIILLGHNNGLSNFASYLTGISVGMQTASCLALEFSCEQSNMISKGTAEIITFYRCQIS